MKYLCLALIALSSSAISMEGPSVHSYAGVIDQGFRKSNSQRNTSFQTNSSSMPPYENINGNMLYKQGVIHYNAASSASSSRKEEHLRTARSLLTQAANENHPAAAELLGEMWENGEGGDQAYGKAEEFFLKAIELGSIQAIYKLEVLYKKTYQNYKRFKLYEKLAKSGKSSAQIALGNMYLEGVKDGEIVKVEPNIRLAIGWFGEAVKLGDIKGLYHLGRTYYTQRSYAEAAKYFGEISKNPQAERLLGKLLLAEVKHALGNINLINNEHRKAQKVYEESYALGNKNVQEKLDMLAKRLPKPRKDEYGQEYQPLL